MIELASYVQAANQAIARDDLLAAIEPLQQALLLAPEHAGIRRTAASVFANASARVLRQGNAPQAQILAEQALALDPAQFNAKLNLAAAYRQLEMAIEAADAYAELVSLLPNDPSIQGFHRQAQLAAAEIELGANQTDAAHTRLHRIASVDLRARLRQLSLPMVYRDPAHVEQTRRQFTERVQGLADAPAARSLEDLLHVNFRLAYQGKDDLALQSMYGDWLVQRSAAFQPRRATKVAGRIGLVSSFFRESTVGAYFGSWISILQKAGFAVEVFQIANAGTQHADQWTEHLFATATRGQILTGDMADIAKRIAERGIDVLIYPELGMDARSFVLASLRLARVQLCAWGHPVTTGLPTIDGIFSCAEMEPMDYQSHYREEPLLLPGIGTCYLAPQMPAAITASDLGLPERTPLVFMPQSAFKLMPENDQRIVAIAQAVPSAKFVMFDSVSPGVTKAIQQRLQYALKQQDCDPECLIALPLMSRSRYLQVNRACHLKVGTIGFSGGNTSIDALLSGLPIWTADGAFMRGRQTRAMLKILGRKEADFSEHMEALRRMSAPQPMSTEDRQRLLEDPACDQALVALIQRFVS